MTIKRSYGEVEFHCDGIGCHEVLETETVGFQTALGLHQESDWITRRDGAEYLHVCPECQANEGPGL